MDAEQVDGKNAHEIPLRIEQPYTNDPIASQTGCMCVSNETNNTDSLYTPSNEQHPSPVIQRESSEQCKTDALVPINDKRTELRNEVSNETPSATSNETTNETGEASQTTAIDANITVVPDRTETQQGEVALLHSDPVTTSQESEAPTVPELSSLLLRMKEADKEVMLVSSITSLTFAQIEKCKAENEGLKKKLMIQEELFQVEVAILQERTKQPTRKLAY